MPHLPTRPLLVSLAALALASGPRLTAADAPAPAKAGPGYTVTLEVKIDEQGRAESARVVSSNDTSVDQLLNRTAIKLAQEIKLAPRLKDGKPVPYKVEAPFVFPVEGDEGPEANDAPRPKIHSAGRPVYPPDLAAKGEVGGVILEALIGANGNVTSLKVLRSSNPEFEKAATDAVSLWSFIPAQAPDGQMVASRWRLAICFETDVRAADWQWHIPPRPSLGYYTVVHRTLPDEPPAAATPAETPAATATPAAKPADGK